MKQSAQGFKEAISQILWDGKTLADHGCAVDVQWQEKRWQVILESTAFVKRDTQVLERDVNRAAQACGIEAPVSVIMTATSDPSRTAKSQQSIPGVAKILAVASGKGGVGKSTVAVNLALALAAEGLRVGILDADIYGPSLPTMMQLSHKPDVTDDKKMIPLRAYGIACMSLGLMMAQGEPVIWRGLMVQSAIKQMLRDVAWGDLDVLVVDMPPGTGDAHITLVQSVPVDGVVIVATPQDLALIDAMRALNFYLRVGVPVIGLVENMSQFVCPQCGHHEDIFSHGGVAREAAERGLPMVGEIPLDKALRQAGDDGVPLFVAASDGVARAAFSSMAHKLKAHLVR